VDAVTLLLLAMKVALVAPAGTVTLEGTVTAPALLVERETRAPPLGAGALNVTVPEEGDPPVTLLGFSASDVRVGPEVGCGVTLREAVCVTPPLEAEIVTRMELGDGTVVTWNAALVAPAATVTLGGTVAAEVLLVDNETAAPPLGAGPLRVTLPVEEFPPLTLVGFSVSEERVGSADGVTVSVADLLTPP
jgi:hypothetical protein